MTGEVPLGEGSDIRRDNDLAGQVLDGINSLSAEDICSFSRRLIGQPTYFDESLPGDRRRELIEADRRTAIASLFDIRLSEVVTSPGTPENFSWQSPRGFIEATVIRCNDAVLFAHEVTVGREGDPLGVVKALWTGNEEAVADFVANGIVEVGEGAEQASESASSSVDEAERLRQYLAEAPPKLRRTGLALLALMSLESALRAAPAGGNFMRGLSPVRGELPEESRPRSHTLRHAAGSMPPVSYRKQPIRQPKPQSGAKRGKRSQF